MGAGREGIQRDEKRTVLKKNKKNSKEDRLDSERAWNYILCAHRVAGHCQVLVPGPSLGRANIVDATDQRDSCRLSCAHQSGPPREKTSSASAAVLPLSAAGQMDY